MPARPAPARLAPPSRIRLAGSRLPACGLQLGWPEGAWLRLWQGLPGAAAQAARGLRTALQPRRAGAPPAFCHLTLLPGQARTLPRPGGAALRVEVISGRIWLTRSGQAADHMLAGGQCLHLTAPGRVVVQAMGREPAWLRIEPGEAGRGG